MLKDLKINKQSERHLEQSLTNQECFKEVKDQLPHQHNEIHT